MAAADPNTHRDVAIGLPRHDGREDFWQRSSRDRTRRTANGAAFKEGARRRRCCVRSTRRQAVP